MSGLNFQSRLNVIEWTVASALFYKTTTCSILRIDDERDVHQRRIGLRIKVYSNSNHGKVVVQRPSNPIELKAGGSDKVVISLPHFLDILGE